jgi:lactose/cellobiose-specific phosphotransferase system IIC component
MINMPVMVIGSFANVFVHLPWLPYQHFMTGLFGVGWHTLGSSIQNATFGLISLLLVMVISYLLARPRTTSQNAGMHPVMASVTSLSCLFAVVQPLHAQDIISIPQRWLGIYGIFPAILIAVVATELFLFIHAKKRMQLEVIDVSDPLVSQVMASLIPFGVTISAFALLKYATVNAGISDLHQCFYEFLRVSLLDGDDSLAMAIKYQLLVQLLWFVGVHGQNALLAVQGIYTATAENNAALYMAGSSPEKYFTSIFFDAFSTIGGAGSTLCLIIAILLVERKGNTAKLAKLSILPAVFNINELLVFGLPLVLNPIYFAPFLLTPVVVTVLSYAAMAVNFAPLTQNLFHWTTPVFMSGFLASHSWTGVVLQCTNIAVGTAIYLPFVRFAKQEKAVKLQRVLGHLLAVSVSQQNAATQTLLHRADDIGDLARALAQDLKEALGKRELSLAYQPQVDRHNRVTGVEALLRWTHASFGPIPPPLIILIAEDSGLIHALGRWIIDSACRQQREWKERGVDNVIMSINVSPMQFQQKRILQHLFQAIKENGIDPRNFEIEITEAIAMDNNDQTQHILKACHRLGLRIAIDDFGMGHSSLSYIKKFHVDTLKIDKVLSRDIDNEKNCQEIVASIIALCVSLGIKTIVEYVETERQRDVLAALGCEHYQGYLYSPARPAEKVLEYILEHNLKG